jgi:hypothetical protein
MMQLELALVPEMREGGFAGLQAPGPGVSWRPVRRGRASNSGKTTFGWVRPHLQLSGGLLSHWYDYLYFSISDGSDPQANGRIYTIVSQRSSGAGTDWERTSAASVVAFPRLAAVADAIRRNNRYDPRTCCTTRAKNWSIRGEMLEAKVEHLLDELYREISGCAIGAAILKYKSAEKFSTENVRFSIDASLLPRCFP